MSGIGAAAAAVLEAPAEEVMAIEDRPESTGNVFVSLLLVEVPMAAVVRTVWLPWFKVAALVCRLSGPLATAFVWLGT